MCSERTKPQSVRPAAVPAAVKVRERVSAFEHGLLAIEAFSASYQKLTVSDVARRAGLSRAAARRYLLTLTAAGYAETDGKHFRLTPKVLRLGYAYLSSASLPRLAQPILDEIGEETDEVAALVVLDGSDATFIASSAQRRIVQAVTRVGTRLPLHVCSTGRVLLAGLADDVIEEHLERASPKLMLTPKTKTCKSELMAEIRRVREQGFSVSNEEVEIGLRAIAVPVKHRFGNVVAALGVSVCWPASRSSELTKRLLPILKRESQNLTTMI
jgi:IclR family pca regulon transcriptional regulator